MKHKPPVFKKLLSKKKSASRFFSTVDDRCVMYVVMNNILSVCSEYSDNVWYSGFEVNEGPQKIAIEIERKYQFHFLKVMARIGYALDSMKRGDSNNSILTLVKSEKSVLAQ